MKTLVQTSMQRILAFFFSFFSFTLSLFHSSSQFKEFDFSVGFLEKRTCCSQHVFCSREGFTSCCTRRESGKSESTNSHRACSRYYQIKWSEVKHQWNKLIIRWKGCRFFIYLFILSLFKAQTFFPCFFPPFLNSTFIQFANTFTQRDVRVRENPNRAQTRALTFPWTLKDYYTSLYHYPMTISDSRTFVTDSILSVATPLNQLAISIRPYPDGIRLTLWHRWEYFFTRLFWDKPLALDWNCRVPFPHTWSCEILKTYLLDRYGL